MKKPLKQISSDKTTTRPIGIFDSGIGGVTVLKEIIKILPHEEYIYYSDSANNPYGDKQDKEIIKLCENIVKLFIERNCKAIVIACNTASAKAVKYLRKKYPNMIFIAIEPAYKMVHDFAYNEPTLVMATKGTIKSEKFNLLFHKYNNHKTYLLPCVGLADLIENGNKEELEKYLKKTLGLYKGLVKNVVLGCTHYPLIQKEIGQVLGNNINFFNGANKLAIHLKEVLSEQNLINASSQTSSQNRKVEFIDSLGKKEKQERFYEILKEYNIEYEGD